VTTFSEIIDRTLGQIQSYGSQQNTATWINQNGGITAADTSFVVNETAQIGRGLLEIGDELVYVDRVDNLTKTVYTTPWGRGFRGTTAAAAANNAMVTVAPTYPRHAVKQAINDTVQASYPEIFGVATTTITYNSSVTAYELPANVQYILSVYWQTTGSSQEWLPVRRYRFDKDGNQTAFPSGKVLNLFDIIEPGRTVQVKYMKAPSLMAASSDVFETVTGFPTSSVDCIVYGSIARLLAPLDASRIPAQSVEADVNDQTRPIGSGGNTARFYLGLYQQRLQIEAADLRNQYPIRLHYTR
jgi:hypothetical protein